MLDSYILHLQDRTSAVDHVLVITKIAHFTATCGIEAGVDLALIQPFLPSHVNHVVLMLNSIFELKLH